MSDELRALRDDAPDDALDGPRRRSWRWPIMSGIVVATALIAFWVFVMHNGRREGAAELPVIHADQHPEKVRPDQPGGVPVPDRDPLVLDKDHAAAAPRVEQLLPPPETPLPPATTQPPTAAAPPAPVAPAPSVAATAIEPPPPLPMRKTLRLQLGALKTREAALAEWKRLKTRYAETLGPLLPITERADLGKRGIMFRLLAGPVSDADAAAGLCSALKKQGQGCIIVKP